MGSSMTTLFQWEDAFTISNNYQQPSRMKSIHKFGTVWLDSKLQLKAKSAAN